MLEDRDILNERILKRFVSRIYFTNTCWIWRGTLYPDGYGSFTIGSNKYRAHRLSYWWFNRKPIINVLDHLCRERKCVNPDHLEDVTIKENLYRSTYYNSDFCPNGHRYTFENTAYNNKGSRRCRACSREVTRRIRANK